jgi:hypothetical protein
MLGAGTVINPIIKIVTTVVILGAVYLFIVKPTLDTTNDVVSQSLGAFNGAFDGLPNDVQDEINSALDGTDLSNADAGALQRCIKNAIGPNGANQDRINRCIDRYGP